MRARTIFLSTLSLSLAVHAIALFAPPLGILKPKIRTETYRIDLMQRSIIAEAAGDSIDESIPETVAEKPRPMPEPAPQPEPQPQIREEVDKVDFREPQEYQTVRAARRRNNGSPAAPRDPLQSQPTTYQRILDELNRLLRQQLTYPEVARRKGIEGTLKVTFTLHTNGSASDIAVSSSSGSRLLDRAALQAISDLFPFPNPPDTPLDFAIPVTYRLTEAD